MPPKIKFKVVKKIEEKPKKKPIKFKVVKPTIGKSITGLSKAEMNKLSPLELFGKLPQELRKKIVNPKQTGVKVGVKAVSSMTFNEIAEAKIKGQDGLVSHAVEKWENSGQNNINA